MTPEVLSISFWKRDSDSIEKTLPLLFTWKDDHFVFQSDSEAKDLTPEESETMKVTLFTTLDVPAMDKEYVAYLYENIPADFNLKFFLVIEYPNHTYFAVKGLRPFRQPHYEDILALFAPFYSQSEKPAKA
jgi:hypothetical protein